MHRLSLAAVLALAIGMITVAPASAASTQSWNCRMVIASDITFFKYSTGSATTYPHKLVYRELFKSHGGYDGRYRAEFLWDTRTYWGYTTSDSRWVTHVSDATCNSHWGN